MDGPPAPIQNKIHIYTGAYTAAMGKIRNGYNPPVVLDQKIPFIEWHMRYDDAEHEAPLSCSRTGRFKLGTLKGA